VSARKDTIAAIATAAGSAALGIVRISGPRALAVLEAVVPNAPFSGKPRRVLKGCACDPRSGDAIDEVLCFFCPGPKTATGEDIAEIHGHGGRIVMNQILAAAIQAGASAAEPGEFTYRAFRNGRMDLTQAEAVMGLIGARSTRAARVALSQLEGGLGRSLETEFEALIDVSAQVEAQLDFPDEDLPVEEAEEIARRLDEIASKLKRASDSFEVGSRLSEGARVAIVGPPNAGKSSLLNRLAGQDKALVDSEPGTTRDVVEARGEAVGIPIVFSDTAGLRSGADRVERRGIEKAMDTAAAADLVVVVLDGATEPKERQIELAAPEHPRMLVAVNKTDLPGWSDWTEPPSGLENVERVHTSALTGEGMENLTKAIARSLGDVDEEDAPMLTTARQHAAVAVCVEHMERAAGLIRRGSDQELAALELRIARDSLASLWGRSATEDVLDAVFSKFCIGK
jgi:tRNA modification GTPase